MGKRKIPPSSDRDGKVAKLSAFGFKVPAVTVTDNDADSVTSKQKATPPPRKFLESWKFGRPWLRYDQEQKLMFCDICVKSSVKNTFTSGCSIMKKECLVKHVKGTGMCSSFQFNDSLDSVGYIKQHIAFDLYFKLILKKKNLEVVKFLYSVLFPDHIDMVPTNKYMYVDTAVQTNLIIIIFFFLYFQTRTPTAQLCKGENLLPICRRLARSLFLKVKVPSLLP
jgi:hypothetical protein